MALFYAVASVKPVLQALVLAEKVYEEAAGRKFIIGTFTAIKLMQVEPPQEIEHSVGTARRMVAPGRSGAPWAYISLTSVVDGTCLSLQFVSLTHNKVLFETGLTVECQDRLKIVEIAVPLPDLEPYVREAGVYAFEIVCEGEILGSLRIHAELA